jgi:hypothetical protein
VRRRRLKQEIAVVNIKSQKDFFSGLMFMGIGVAFAWGSCNPWALLALLTNGFFGGGACNYALGTGAKMGPGYFPLVLGILLAGMGSIITFKALVVETVDGDKIGSIAWRPLVFIILANLVFGAMIGGLPSLGLPPMGLIVGIYALTLIACLAGDGFKLRDVLVLATILAVFSYLAFIKLLNLQFPVWPAFIGA